MERGNSDDEARDGNSPGETQANPDGQDANSILGAQRLHRRVCHLSHLINTLLHSLSHQPEREREARLESVRSELNQLHRVYNDLYNGLTALGNRAREILDTVCEQLFRKLPNIVQQLAACENRRWRDKERIKELQNKIRNNERILARQDAALERNDSRLSTLEFGSYDGKLTWKIADFKSKRQEAISGKDGKIESPYFYTSRREGYKMFARIYLNGEGEGKGTHISLYLIIVKGDYDALLRWPFRQKITFECVDQNGGPGLTESYHPDITSAAFKRPTSGANIASGCPLFLPLSELKSTHRALVRDDTMFIKVTVDFSNLH